MSESRRLVDAYIQKNSPPLNDWLNQLRALIHQAIPDVIESIKWGRPVFSHQQRNICYLDSNLRNGYVTLGFYNGIGLPDPNGLLEGEGKKLRHLKIHSENDLKKDVITNWLHRAAETG